MVSTPSPAATPLKEERTHKIAYASNCEASWQVQSIDGSRFVIKCRRCGTTVCDNGTPKCLAEAAPRQQKEGEKLSEYILCAAINFKGTIICGHRHGDCYTVLRDLLSKYITFDDLPAREDQGFLTSFNRYVDRKEAWKIAKANNQIIYGLSASDNGEESILISENLY